MKEGSISGSKVRLSAHGAEASHEIGEIYAAATLGKEIIMEKKVEYTVYPSNSKVFDDIIEFPLDMDPKYNEVNVVLVFVIKSYVTNYYTGYQYLLK